MVANCETNLTYVKTWAKSNTKKEGEGTRRKRRLQIKKMSLNSNVYYIYLQCETENDLKAFSIYIHTAVEFVYIKYLFH